MKQLTIYRILTYILIPVACFFGLMGFLILIPALSNPPMWFMLFMFASLVIYTFSSLKFLSNGIDRNAPCKPSLRDWIRVNAFVCLGMGALFFLNAVGIYILGPVALQDFVERAMESQPNLPEGIDSSLFISIIKGVAGFMLVVSILIVAHVIFTFKMLKLFVHVFQSSPLS